MPTEDQEVMLNALAVRLAAKLATGSAELLVNNADTSPPNPYYKTARELPSVIAVPP